MRRESMRRYKDQRDKLRQYFEMQRIGDQSSFLDQTKLFRPLIDSHEQSSKNIAENLTANQEVLTNVLVPLHQRIDMLRQPLAIEAVSQSTPKKDREIVNVNLDTGLTK